MKKVVVMKFTLIKWLKLEKIHSSHYTKEQIRAWAQLKKHDSFDIAPDKPFW